MICPYCRGGVRDGAKKCWHCGAELTGNPISGSPGTHLPGQAQPPASKPASAFQPLAVQPVLGLPEQPEEPVITLLSDKEKQQFMVVEGYTNSDPLDLDHLKYLLFSSEGRINRRRYWIGSILNSLSMFVLGMVAYFISEKLMLLVMLFFVYPGVMLMLKRCHDRDRSGHFIWVFLIPIVSLWPAAELAFLRGTPGINSYGPDSL